MMKFFITEHSDSLLLYTTLPAYVEKLRNKLAFLLTENVKSSRNLNHCITSLPAPLYSYSM